MKGHLTQVFQTLGVTDRTQAALWAERHGLSGERGVSRAQAAGRATDVSLHDPAGRPTIEAVTSGRRRGRALAVLLTVALIATARPVAAVLRDAPCTGPSHWRLRVVPDGNVLRVRLSVRGGRAAQRWNIFMDHNRTGFFAGHRISGEASMDRAPARLEPRRHRQDPLRRPQRRDGRDL